MQNNVNTALGGFLCLKKEDCHRMTTLDLILGRYCNSQDECNSGGSKMGSKQKSLVKSFDLTRLFLVGAGGFEPPKH